MIVFLPKKNKDEKNMRNFTRTDDYFSRTYGTFIHTEMTLFAPKITKTVKNKEFMVRALLALTAPISAPYHLFLHRTRTKQLECSEKEKNGK